MTSDQAIVALLARLTAEGIMYQQRIAELERENKSLKEAIAPKEAKA